MVKVFVCGEGRHDIGTHVGRRNAAEREGWLQILLRKLMGEEDEFRAVRRNRLILQRREQWKF